jgi:hypothetical protein
VTGSDADGALVLRKVMMNADDHIVNDVIRETNLILFLSFFLFRTTTSAFSGKIQANSAFHFDCRCDFAMVLFLGNAVMMASRNGFFM